MVVVLARIKARREFADEVAGHFRDLVAWIADNEASTLTYACNRSQADPGEFVFFERYADMASFHAHSQSARFGELIAKLQGKLTAAPEITMLDEVAAKL
ncbi:MAG TPA: putative quinol monooxygenase [Candidatus Binatia bacterium]|jgi:quinol monooxygenase YgiN